MTISHHRKKQPILVRTSIIQAAKSLSEKDGLPAISIQSVCERVGVTKGAFFHHFENKDELLDCVFEQLISDFSREIENLMKEDPYEYGAFTRAYLELGISTMKSVDALIFWKSAMSDEKMCFKWKLWFSETLKQYGELEQGPNLDIVRLAVDGLCLGMSMDIIPQQMDAVIIRLRQLCTSPTALDLNSKFRDKKS